MVIQANFKGSLTAMRYKSAQAVGADLLRLYTYARHARGGQAVFKLPAACINNSFLPKPGIEKRLNELRPPFYQKRTDFSFVQRGEQVVQKVGVKRELQIRGPMSLGSGFRFMYNQCWQGAVENFEMAGQSQPAIQYHTQRRRPVK